MYNEQLNEEIDKEKPRKSCTQLNICGKQRSCNKICKKIGSKPPAIPGKTWVISWALIDTPKEVVEKSFEEVILDKMKGPTQKEQTKRKKLIER